LIAPVVTLQYFGQDHLESTHYECYTLCIADRDVSFQFHPGRQSHVYV